jgi:uncharacterized protein (UPF0264 family)
MNAPQRAMKLLVSAADAADALAAVEGGADFVDAKNPRVGALGPVTLDTLREIHQVVAGRRPVTAALGDVDDEGTAELKAASFAAAGATLVKIGFGEIACTSMIEALIRAAVHGAGKQNSGVVAVSYADQSPVAAPGFIEAAAAAGARGVLFDTADKAGPGLTAILTPDDIAAVARRAHAAGLFLAVAGKLRESDLPIVRLAGADVAGVRSAACAESRTSPVSAAKVQALGQSCATANAILVA